MPGQDVVKLDTSRSEDVSDRDLVVLSSSLSLSSVVLPSSVHVSLSSRHVSCLSIYHDVMSPIHLLLLHLACHLVVFHILSSCTQWYKALSQKRLLETLYTPAHRHARRDENINVDIYKSETWPFAGKSLRVLIPPSAAGSLPTRRPCMRRESPTNLASLLCW